MAGVNDGAAAQTCNARALWEFVESKQDFSTWIKGRIEKYGFVEGEDFAVHKFMERQNQGVSAGQSRIDYYLTIEMSKELAMVENNEKGRQILEWPQTRCSSRQGCTPRSVDFSTIFACRSNEVSSKRAIEFLGS